MADFGAIASALSGIKTALDIAKGIREANAQLETADFKLRLADMMGALADARISIADVQQQLSEKDAMIEELQTAVANSETVVKRYDAYYSVDEAGNPKGDPFCLKCWEHDHKLHHLAYKRGMGSVCHVCKAVYDAHRAATVSQESSQ
jgi:hypothetical protein